MTDAKPKQPPATTAAAASAAAAVPTPVTVPTPPSPLLIGKAFIKQYYQVLSTNPTQITKFYKPNSLISHSLLPSVPATTTTLLQQTDLFSWCKPKNKKDKICFDFGKGAIDAQETINGGILLVVTGHVRLDDGNGNGNTGKDAQGEDEKRFSFVHTFFLNNGAPVGKKRQFYVHNDVLRFLDEGLDLSLSNGGDEVQEEVQAPDEQQQEVGNNEDDKVTGDEKVQAKAQEKSEKEEPVAAAAAVEVMEKVAPVEKEETPKETKDEAKEEKDVVDSKAKVVEESKDAEHVHATKEDKVSSASSAAPATSAPEGKKDKSTESGKDAEAKKDGKENASVFASDSAKPAKSDEKKGKSANATTAATATTTTTTATLQEKKPRKNKSRGRARKSRSSSPTDVGNSNSSSKGKKAAVPSSWASLVARSGPSTVAADVAAAVENTKGEKDAAAPVPASSASTSNASNNNSNSGNANVNAKKSSNGAAKQESTTDKQKVEQASSDQESQAQPQVQQQQQQQPLLSKKAAVALRQPEATVLIKNIPAKTLEPEIRAMFEPFASKLQKRILGVTLLPNRGFCFVDFDSKAVVDAIVKDVEAEKEAQAKSKKEGEDVPVSKFIVNGRVLEVGRKIPAEKAVSGGRGRGSRRSSSPNRGGYKNNRGGGRRNSPRGGNRSANKK